ncbi:hypothetical protein LCGC14_1184160 [marine sediment metagenome]|uniref:Uncharacterized protein n=1 Tax=marine sediment metagenome TaxID=412755 RepID=A0A0F9M937_9ZZZZ|nr:hypothetical protein [Candidatus Aminicenantes bacterium]
MKANWPSIDHSILSPSGKISKRSKDAYMKRFVKELFGPDGLQPPQCQQLTEKERLLRNAGMWRDLANRGMNPGKYNKQADEAEAKAALL